MKKAFLLLIAVMMLTGTVWFSVGAASDASIKTTVYSEFFMDAKAGEQVPAQLGTADGNLQDLSCAATEYAGYVSCQFPEKYAGQHVPVQLTKDKVMHVFVVNVPVN
jgi:hypothetical protein